MKRNGKAFAYLFLAIWSMTSIGCTSSSKEERAVREIPVKTWTVSLREGVYTRSYIGEIEGESSSSLSFQVPGYVECIYVKEIYYEKLAHTIMKADKSQELQG